MISVSSRGRPAAWRPGRMVVALVAAALLGGGASALADETDADQLDLARQRGVLEVAVYKDFPPYSYTHEGQVVGVDAEIAAALARELGLPLKLRSMIAGEDSDDDLRNNIWKGHYLGGGVADLMLHTGIDPVYVERQDKCELFGAYFHEAVSLAYRPSRYPNFRQPNQLIGTKVAVELDSISDSFMSGGLDGRLRTSAVRFPHAIEAVQAFARDEVDSVMAPRGELQGLLRIVGGPEVSARPTEFQGLFRNEWDIGMAIKAGNPKLSKALHEALARLVASGELAAIFARNGIDYVPPRLIAKPVAARP